MNATRQQGLAFFVHAGHGHSPVALWGLDHSFQPNTKYVGTDPLDFSRAVGGISYKVNEHFDLAFGDDGMVGAQDTNAIAIWTQSTASSEECQQS